MPDLDPTDPEDLPPVIAGAVTPPVEDKAVAPVVAPAADPPPPAPPVDPPPAADVVAPELVAEVDAYPPPRAQRRLPADVSSRVFSWWSRRVRQGDSALRGEAAERFDEALLEGLSHLDFGDPMFASSNPDEEPSLTFSTNDRGVPNEMLRGLLMHAGVSVELPPYLCMKITEHDVRVL